MPDINASDSRNTIGGIFSIASTPEKLDLTFKADIDETNCAGGVACVVVSVVNDSFSPAQEVPLTPSLTFGAIGDSQTIQNPQGGLTVTQPESGSGRDVYTLTYHLTVTLVSLTKVKIQGDCSAAWHVGVIDLEVTPIL